MFQEKLETWPVAMPASAASHIRSQYLRTTLGLEGSHAGRKGAHVFSAVRQSIGLPVRVLCHELSLIWANWVHREEPFVQWKAAAFARWHEPDDARVSSPDL